MQYSLLKEMYEMEEDYWWHRGKRNYVISLIKKFNHIVNPKILDIGCGTGYLLKDLENYGQPYGIDKSKMSLSFSKRRGIKNLRNLDIEKKSFPGIKFDVAIALDVIEHIKDDSKAVRNIANSLKRNGIFVFAAPAFPSLWSYWDEVAGHYRRYDAKSLKKLFANAGLNIEYMRFTNVVIFIPATVIRLFKQKFGSNNQSDFIRVPKFLNLLFFYILKLEMLFSFIVPFPFGLSYIIVARKTEKS